MAKTHGLNRTSLPSTLDGMTDEFDIGHRLDALIARSGKQKIALAAHLGVSAQAVQGWINDGTLARKHVRSICQFLVCSADELFGLVELGSDDSTAAHRAALRRALVVLEDSVRTLKRAVDG